MTKQEHQGDTKVKELKDDPCPLVKDKTKHNDHTWWKRNEELYCIGYLSETKR